MAIGRTNTGGGGGGLNFSVIGSSTVPSGAKENMIWVNTSTPITSWIFSATEPESPVEGMVWFTLTLESPVAFNAAKKNAVMLYPVSASQFVAGVWVPKNVKSYQGNAWVDWWIPGTLFDSGRVDESFSGNWTSFNYKVDTGYSGIASTVTLGEASVTATMKSNGTNRSSFFAHGKTVDLSQYTNAHFEFLNASGAGWARIMVFDANGTSVANGPQVWSTGGSVSKSVDMDISGITKEGRIGVMMWANSSTAVITVEMSLARLS